MQFLLAIILSNLALGKFAEHRQSGTEAGTLVRRHWVRWGAKLRRIFKATWLTINILVCLVFVLSCIAPYINPNTTGVLAVFGLGLPIAFSMLSGLLLIGVFVNRKLAMLPLILLIGGSYNLHNYVPIFPQPHIPSEYYKNISIMSWNVMNFDLLNNHHTSTKIKEEVIAKIQQENPDILVLQEFYSGTDSLYNTRDELRKQYTYHYFESPVRTEDGQKKWGQAIFSKYPIVNKERINFPNTETNKAIIADIVVDGQMVRVFNLHMQSVHFQPSEYLAIDNLKSGSIGSFPLADFYEKIKEAFQKRGKQADMIAKHIQNTNVPVIVAGDFNDTPHSYTYRAISRGLQDAFWQTGHGFGSTYNGPIPGLRIDHLLVDARIKVEDFGIIKADITDHFPIKSIIGIPVE